MSACAITRANRAPFNSGIVRNGLFGRMGVRPARRDFVHVGEDDTEDHEGDQDHDKKDWIFDHRRCSLELASPVCGRFRAAPLIWIKCAVVGQP